MTEKEAIKRIENHIAVHHIGEYPHLHINEALCMAITALIEREQRRNPDRLTMEEMRNMDAPVWCLCKPIEGGDGYWCLCKKGRVITPSGMSFDVSDVPKWVFLRNKPME